MPMPIGTNDRRSASESLGRPLVSKCAMLQELAGLLHLRLTTPRQPDRIPRVIVNDDVEGGVDAEIYRRESALLATGELTPAESWRPEWGPRLIVRVVVNPKHSDA